MKNQVLFTLALVIMSFMASAQERYFDERYISAQSFMFPVLVNPGAIGVSGDHELLFNYRNSWSSFEGSPSTIHFNYNGNLGNRVGFGAGLFRDSFGELETTKGLIGFSYTIDSPTNKLGFGLNTEYVQHRLGGGALDGVDATDEVILRRLDGAQFFDISVGVHGVYDEKVTYGVSFPSLVSSRVSEDVPGEETEREIGMILYGGYDYHSVGSGIHIIPSITIKKLNQVPTHVDLNMMFNFLEEKLVSGVNYTLGGEKRLGFLLGTKIDNVGFNYSYNISNTEFQKYNNGAHEITLSLNLSAKKKMINLEGIQ